MNTAVTDICTISADSFPMSQMWPVSSVDIDQNSSFIELVFFNLIETNQPEKVSIKFLFDNKHTDVLQKLVI